MALTWEAQQASIEMVLRALKVLALSTAYTTEVHDRWRLATDPGAAPLFAYVDANGAQTTVRLADDSFSTPGVPVAVAQWMSDTFREVRVEDITDPESMSGAWPQLRLIPGRGRDTEQDDGYNIGIRTWEFPIECAIITSQDQPDAAQRDALVLADAWDSLLRRNENLGGLVHSMRAAGPPVPGGYGHIANDLLAAALVHLEVKVLKR